MELLKNYCALQEMVIYSKFDVDYNVFMILFMILYNKDLKK